jgi:DNA-binding MarR family transcriptional regulator
VGAGVPLPTLLSQALVAYTIEFDNEAGHLLPHTTSDHGATAGSGPKPWLASMVMWFNCMKYVGPDGVQLGEMERLARTRTNLAGMQRWRYITITPGSGNRDGKRPGPDAVVRATAGGRKAQEVWGPLFGVIDERWRQRFGDKSIADLQTALSAIVDRVDLELPDCMPDCMPILGYGLFSSSRLGAATYPPRNDQSADGAANLPLSSLLARVLLAFAVDFEEGSRLSLAITANVLRVLDKDGVRVRDLPMLTGVSKEAVSMSVGFLEKRDCVTVEPVPPPGRGQVVRLTTQGQIARQVTSNLVVEVEDHWQTTRFGTDAVRSLRSSLEPIVGDGTAQSPPFAGLTPYPDGWRADVRPPDTLPHFPMVLHRGGYPDGS